MKRILSTAFSLAALCLLVNAQQKGFGQNDPEAKKVLDAASAKVKAYKTLKAGFTFKLESANGKTNETKKGTMLMKGTKYRVTFAGQEIFCDGTNTWTYDKRSNEVQVSKVDNSANTITPQKLFTNFYDKDFLYKLNADIKLNGKATQEIEMTPYDKNKPFFKVLLWVDKTTKTISGTKVLNKDGNKYSITVNSSAPNAAITDDQFVFDQKKYPGVEVIDLR
ncbi:MAG: outer membrane lipoprotein carrier protein LolA [Sphingobacteriales bacterium]|nr:outer membrane lipoprotein carrier protein LolA [Sphingobacteriales bacterium]MBI3717342.1 outer membrane lipoprotein carrier protein LolA [Sphingobacteriales bacterium]